MAHLRAVLSDPGVVPLPQSKPDFSELHTGPQRELESKEEWTVCARLVQVSQYHDGACFQPGQSQSEPIYQWVCSLLNQTPLIRRRSGARRTGRPGRTTAASAGAACGAWTTTARGSTTASANGTKSTFCSSSSTSACCRPTPSRWSCSRGSASAPTATRTSSSPRRECQSIPPTIQEKPLFQDWTNICRGPKNLVSLLMLCSSLHGCVV